MGRSSTKTDKNIYQLSTEEHQLSRKKTSVLIVVVSATCLEWINKTATENNIKNRNKKTQVKIKTCTEPPQFLQAFIC